MHGTIFDEAIFLIALGPFLADVIFTMTNLPEDLKYTQNHEWIRAMEDSTAFVGITYFAQESLGDITFVELPKPGAIFNQGDVFGVIESVKAASDIYMPVSGEVLEVNPELDASPEVVNASPYEDGWLIKIKLNDPQELDLLFPPEDYQGFIAN